MIFVLKDDVKQRSSRVIWNIFFLEEDENKKLKKNELKGKDNITFVIHIWRYTFLHFGICFFTHIIFIAFFIKAGYLFTSLLFFFTSFTTKFIYNFTHFLFFTFIAYGYICLLRYEIWCVWFYHFKPLWVQLLEVFCNP